MKGFKQKIKEISKNKKTTIYFDMDGVCSEFLYEREKVETYHKDYFLNKRPIKSVIKIMKSISKFPNIKIKILSLCNFEEQKIEKQEWLKKYIPFIKKEDILIITKSSISYLPEEKNLLKAKEIEIDHKNREVAVLIEDDHEIVKKSQKYLKKLYVFHVSSLIK